MNVNEISEISRIMAKFGITEFNAESEGYKLKMKREQQVVAAAPVAAAPVAVAAAPVAAAPAAAEAAPAEPVGETIDAPIVGTFYATPAPDQPAFVKVGDTVTADSVVCIVEAMKVMNEIKAEKAGTIKEILVESGTPVEYGQPLFVIG